MFQMRGTHEMMGAPPLKPIVNSRKGGLQLVFLNGLEPHRRHKGDQADRKDKYKAWATASATEWSDRERGGGWTRRVEKKRGGEIIRGNQSPTQTVPTNLDMMKSGTAASPNTPHVE